MLRNKWVTIRTVEQSEEIERKGQATREAVARWIGEAEREAARMKLRPPNRQTAFRAVKAGMTVAQWSQAVMGAAVLNLSTAGASAPRKKWRKRFSRARGGRRAGSRGGRGGRRGFKLPRRPPAQGRFGW